MRISDWSSDVCSSDLADLDQILVGLTAVAEAPGAVLDERQVQLNEVVTRHGALGRAALLVADDGEQRSTGPFHCRERRLGWAPGFGTHLRRRPSSASSSTRTANRKSTRLNSGH